MISSWKQKGLLSESDKELAEDTFFKGSAASGWHTAAITMKLLTRIVCPLLTGLSVLVGRLNGHSQHAQMMPYM